MGLLPQGFVGALLQIIRGSGRSGSDLQHGYRIPVGSSFLVVLGLVGPLLVVALLVAALPLPSLEGEETRLVVQQMPWFRFY